jgi:error-prone DNA polymerase
LHERASPFAELLAASNYSFLRGASSPAEMVARAQQLGMAGIGMADRNTVAGVVRAHVAWREIGGSASGLRLVVGARLVFSPPRMMDTSRPTSWPTR